MLLTPEAQRQFLVYYHNRGVMVYTPGDIRFLHPVSANYARQSPFVNILIPIEFRVEFRGQYIWNLLSAQCLVV